MLPLFLLFHSHEASTVVVCLWKGCRSRHKALGKSSSLEKGCQGKVWSLWWGMNTGKLRCGSGSLCSRLLGQKRKRCGTCPWMLQVSVLGCWHCFCRTCKVQAKLPEEKEEWNLLPRMGSAISTLTCGSLHLSHCFHNTSGNSASAGIYISFAFPWCSQARNVGVECTLRFVCSSDC